MEIRLGLVPEEHRALQQCAVLDQQPKQAQLPHTFGEKRELQIPLLAAEEKLLIAHRDFACHGALEDVQQPLPVLVRRAAKCRAEGAVEDVRVDLLEVNFALRVERAEAWSVGQHLLDGNEDALQWRRRTTSSPR